MSQEFLLVPQGRVVKQDAFKYLEMVPPESVDLIITDPPYESLEKHRATGTTTRLTQEWFPTIPNKRFDVLLEYFHIILKPDRHCYVICDDETSDIAIKYAKEIGFKYWKRIVWDKMRMGMGYHYRNQHEFILFFEKGKRKLTDLSVPSIVRYKVPRRAKGDPDYYPTEKPLDLLGLLIHQSSEPGELVLDPFAGSGSTLVAAKMQGRRYMGCDIGERAVELANRRLNAELPDRSERSGEPGEDNDHPR